MGLAIAIILALSSWISGTIVESQGQLLRAGVDAAINGSPFLNNEQRARLMGVAVPNS